MPRTGKNILKLIPVSNVDCLAANTTEDSTADCKRNKTAKRQAETVSQQQYLQELPMPAKRAKSKCGG